MRIQEKSQVFDGIGHKDFNKKIDANNEDMMMKEETKPIKLKNFR